MFTKTINTSSITKFTALFALSFCFFAADSLAQEERDVERVEFPSESVESQDLSLDKEIASKPMVKEPTAKINSTLPSKTNQIKTPLVVTGENSKIKKEESSSTLSFNLFLYIVDKFRED